MRIMIEYLPIIMSVCLVLLAYSLRCSVGGDKRNEYTRVP